MRGEETKEEEGIERRNSKAEAKTDMAMTPSVAEEENTSSASNNKTCSNGRSRENKCSNSEKAGTVGGGSPQKRPLCYGSK